MLGIFMEDMQQSRIMIQGFNQGLQRTLGKLSLHQTIGELKTTLCFYLIDPKVSYKYCKDGVESNIKADGNLFIVEESHFGDVKYYVTKEKGKTQPPPSAKTHRMSQVPHEISSIRHQADDDITTALKEVGAKGPIPEAITAEIRLSEVEVKYSMKKANPASVCIPKALVCIPKVGGITISLHNPEGESSR
ncbi:hypothetical protein LIER_05224 [Lithospermum erythrorhizon]|uniref:Uncharacterized protein n=1 Tax=Lithospermum erythrorhizon TaxID=34254 RepID=A0AAV3P4J9_LITER